MYIWSTCIKTGAFKGLKEWRIHFLNSNKKTIWALWEEEDKIWMLCWMCNTAKKCIKNIRYHLGHHYILNSTKLMYYNYVIFVWLYCLWCIELLCQYPFPSLQMHTKFSPQWQRAVLCCGKNKTINHTSRVCWYVAVSCTYSSQHLMKFTCCLPGRLCISVVECWLQCNHCIFKLQKLILPPSVVATNCRAP